MSTGTGTAVQLHDYILSAEAYAVRLMLRMLGVAWTPVKTDIHPGRDHASLGFLALNPLGTLPVLGDGDVVLRTPQAILVYLAASRDPSGTWLPREPASAGRVQQWLSFAGEELAGLSRLRMQSFTGREPDERLLPQALRALEVLDDHLAAREQQGGRWVVGDHPTIADVALFPTVALAPDAGLSLDAQPAVWRWVNRFKRLPGFTVMPGIHPILPGEA